MLARIGLVRRVPRRFSVNTSSAVAGGRSAIFSSDGRGIAGGSWNTVPPCGDTALSGSNSSPRQSNSAEKATMAIAFVRSYAARTFRIVLMSSSRRPAAVRASGGNGGSWGKSRSSCSAAASAAIVPSAYSGRSAAQTQGRAPGIVARWRQIKLTTSTPSTPRISAKISAMSPVAADSVIAGTGSLIFDLTPGGSARRCLFASDRGAFPRTASRPPASGRGSWIIRGVQRAPCLFVEFFLESVAAARGPRLGDRWPVVARPDPALDIREGGERVVAPGEHDVRAIDPAPRRDIGDRVTAADDEGPVFNMLVEHRIVPLRLAPISVDGVGQALRSHALEMHGLAGKRTEPRADVEEP